jgi:rhodanese-related sulfurtransferase
MANSAQAGASVRIDPEEVKRLLSSGEAMTVIDARNPSAWAASNVKIPGAVHVDAGQLRVDPQWPKQRLTVVY